MNKPEIVIYDFCGTIVDFQTANAYVNFVVSEKHVAKNWVEYTRIALNRLHVIPLLNRIFRHKYINKAMILHRLKGCTCDELDYYAREFYNTHIKRHLIHPVIERLKEDVITGKTVVIVSGGYDIYLKYFASEFEVANVICSSLAFKNGFFLGKIYGAECMGINKVTKLLAFFNINDLSELFKKVTVYSDSESDKPLFQISDTKIVVSSTKWVPAWANEINAEILYVIE